MKLVGAAAVLVLLASACSAGGPSTTRATKHPAPGRQSSPDVRRIHTTSPLAPSPTSGAPVLFDCRLPIARSGNPGVEGFLTFPAKTFMAAGTNLGEYDPVSKRWLPTSIFSPDGSQYAYMATSATTPPSNAELFTLKVGSRLSPASRNVGYSVIDRLAGPIGWGSRGIFVAHGTLPEQTVVTVNPSTGSWTQVGPAGYAGRMQFRWFAARNDFVWGASYNLDTSQSQLIYMSAWDGAVHDWYSRAGEYPDFFLGFRADGSPLVVMAAIGGAPVEVVAIPSANQPQTVVADLPAKTFGVVEDGSRIWLGVDSDLWLADVNGLRMVATGYRPLGGCS